MKHLLLACVLSLSCSAIDALQPIESAARMLHLRIKPPPRGARWLLA